MKRSPPALLLTALLPLIAACGGGGGGPAPVVQGPDPLTVDAGVDQIVTFTQLAALAGVVSDASADVQWSKLSGPGDVTFESTSALLTRASFGRGGDYVLRLTANDGTDQVTDQVSVRVAAPQGVVMDLDAATRYQTMRGWEFTDFAGQNSLAFDNYKTDLFDRAVNDLGLNRVRLEVMAVTEHDADYYQMFKDGTISYQAWRDVRGSCANDNDDADVVDGAGFHWTKLDENVDRVVEPMRQLVEANGEKLWINVCYVAFTQLNGGQYGYIHDDPDEYAEFVLATYQHLESKYGWVPDSWEMILEPDYVPEWNGTHIGETVLKVASRLSAAGYTPRFVAPSISNAAGGFDYITQMLAVAGAAQYVIEAAYHRYDSPPTSAIAAIWNAAQQAGVGTAHLERIGAGYHELHEDLKVGNNSSWSQYVLATLGPDDGGGYYVVNDSIPSSPTLTMGSRTRFLRQYFKFVRAGAVRVDLTSAGAFNSLAFENADGRTVAILKASSGGDFALVGLPPGTYGVKYTTDAAFDVDLPDVTVTVAGQGVEAGIPAAGVITVYARP